MTKPLLLIALFSFIACGCTTNHQRIFWSLPSTTSDRVQILYSKPSTAYSVVAENQMMGANESVVKKWAAKVGADAAIVVVSNVNSITSGGFSVSGSSAVVEQIGSRFGNNSINGFQQIFVTAIKYNK
jgi:hypothetical protein